MKSVIIIGAGAGGLLSALVLSKHYDDILLIDRFWPDEKGASQGTPQSCHLHVLLAEGQRLLASLLPEVWRQLTAASLSEVDWGKETWWKTPQGLTIILKQLDVLKPQEKRNWLNQKRLHRCNWFPWLLASQQDNLSSKGTLVRWLLEKILLQAVADPAVGKIFLKIMHHKISPLWLLNPKLLTQLIRKQHYD